MVERSSPTCRGSSPGRLLLLHCVLCAVLLTGGCVANRSYRRTDEAVSRQISSIVDPLKPDGDCAQLPAYSCIPDETEKLKPQNFYLSYIEFDDMGELWSIGDLNTTSPRPSTARESQMEAAVAIIRRAKKKAQSKNTELVVIAFIHGWHNNASKYDEDHKNLQGFKIVLQGLSFRKSLLDPHKSPVLVGIFISWRGQALAGDPFVTYWNRRDTATRIGGPSMTEAITRLMFETKGTSSPPDPSADCRSDASLAPNSNNNIDRNSRFLVIGHSFGARILETAISQPMLAILLERQAQAESCVNTWKQRHAGLPPPNVSFQPPADLIVFLNAANSSLQTKSVIEAFKRSHLCATPAVAPASGAGHGHDGCGDLSVQGPLLISITSKGDWATGKVMPVAQTLSVTDKAFREYDPGPEELDQLRTRHQIRFFLHNEGNVPEMRSHVVQYLNDVKTDADCGKDDWPFFTANTSGHLRCFNICTLAENYGSVQNPNCPKNQPAPPWNNTPFYVMSVPSELIADHNDIFQDGTVKLLNAIVVHYIIGAPTVLTAPAPSPNRPLSQSAQ